jgi:ribose-phosphate pyrophosphokinase
MFFPDEGAMKRYASKSRLPYAFGIKKRDWETGVIEGLDVAGEIDQIVGRDILIVDDICSKGGTFYHSAKKLKELGANKIYLYVTHCENTILEGELLTSGLVEKVYTTNSIFTKEHDMIEVFEL